jgi:hypothetical protein
MVEAHMIFNVFMYAIVIAYILYINFATYYNSGTNFLNFLIKLFNNWIFRLIFLLNVGFFALDLFPYGGFIFAILLTIAFLNTNMLVYKKQMYESFESFETRNTIKPAPYEQSNQEEKYMDGSDLYVRNDTASLLEPMANDGMKQGSLLSSSEMYGE